MSFAVNQRTVPAASAPRLQTTAPNSPFNWRPAGEVATDADASPNAQPEENDLPTDDSTEPARRHRPTKATSPRFQICTLLLAGDKTRDELRAGMTDKAETPFNSAIYNGKKDGQLTMTPTGKYHLTKDGKEWLTGGANLEQQRGASFTPAKKRKAPAAAKKAKAPAPVKTRRRGAIRVPAEQIAVRPAPPATATVPSPTFRCAVFSDGGFFLAKDGKEIELTATEHAAMLRYQERMAEVEA